MPTATSPQHREQRSTRPLNFMRQAPAWLMLACSFLAIEVDGHADTASARKAIQTQYARMDTALRKNDIRSYIALCMPDYRQKTQNAVIDRNHLYQQLRQLLDAVQNYKQTTQIEEIHLRGNEARVVTTESFTFSMTDSDPQQKKSHQYRQSIHNRDIWVYRNKRWLLQYTKTEVLH
jgi:hypothetical protein